MIIIFSRAPTTTYCTVMYIQGMQELSIVLLGDIRRRYPSFLHVVAVLPLLSYRDAFCREGVRKHGGFVTTEDRISLYKPTCCHFWCLLWAHNQTTSCNYKQVWFQSYLLVPRLSQHARSPSLFISGSGSWRQREGLLSSLRSMAVLVGRAK